jgi:hypothetical protein
MISKRRKQLLFIKEFGITLTAKVILYRNLAKRTPENKKQIFIEKEHEIKKRRLQKEFSEFIHRFLSEQQTTNYIGKEEIEEIPKKVWMFWWQGNHNDVKVVTICMKSIRNHLPEGAELIVLTKDNVSQYCEIPDFIYQKLDKGFITLTHFSDILRVTLLEKWGGCWLDATILAVSRFDYVFDSRFWSIKHNTKNRYIPEGRWTSYALASAPHCRLFEMMKQLFFKYWSCHDCLIDLFLVDFFIDLLYTEVEEFRKLIDEVPVNNKNVQSMRLNLNTIYNDETYNSICKSTELFKLTWREQFKEKNNGEATFYAKLIQENV